MPYTSPAAIVTGTTISKTTFGDVVKADLDYLANPPACRVTKSALQVITTGAPTAIIFDSERYDTDTMHDTVTNNTRITIRTAGLYLVGANVEWASSTLGTYRQLSIRLNGSTAVAWVLQAPPSQVLRQNLSAVYKFAVNDYVELIAEHDKGSDINVSLTGNISPEFWATWLGLG